MAALYRPITTWFIMPIKVRACGDRNVSSFLSKELVFRKCWYRHPYI